MALFLPWTGCHGAAGKIKKYGEKQVAIIKYSSRVVFTTPHCDEAYNVTCLDLFISSSLSMASLFLAFAIKMSKVYLRTLNRRECGLPGSQRSLKVFAVPCGTTESPLHSFSVFPGCLSAPSFPYFLAWAPLKGWIKLRCSRNSTDITFCVIRCSAVCSLEL